MGPLRRGACRVGALAASTAVLLAVSGCTGKPSSTSAWQGSSDRVLGTAISGLGTARLIVTQDQRSHLPHTYTVVGGTDAIETTSKDVSGYLTEQPPDSQHDAQRTLTDALQQTVTLLSEVRIELASPGLDAAAARALLKRIDAMRQRLDDLQTGVTSSPPTVSPR